MGKQRTNRISTNYCQRSYQGVSFTLPSNVRSRLTDLPKTNVLLMLWLMSDAIDSTKDPSNTGLIYEFRRKALRTTERALHHIWIGLPVQYVLLYHAADKSPAPLA